MKQMKKVMIVLLVVIAMVATSLSAFAGQVPVPDHGDVYISKTIVYPTNTGGENSDVFIRRGDFVTFRVKYDPQQSGLTSQERVIFTINFPVALNWVAGQTGVNLNNLDHWSTWGNLSSFPPPTHVTQPVYFNVPNPNLLGTGGSRLVANYFGNPQRIVIEYNASTAANQLGPFYFDFTVLFNPVLHLNVPGNTFTTSMSVNITRPGMSPNIGIIYNTSLTLQVGSRDCNVYPCVCECIECNELLGDCKCCEDCDVYPCACECIECNELLADCKCCEDCDVYPCACECIECNELLADCKCCGDCDVYPCVCECSECNELLADCKCCDVCETYPCECLIPINRDYLAAAIEELDYKDLGAYTPESIAALEQALANAVQVYNNPNATQAEIDAATQALRDAIDSLAIDPGLTPPAVRPLWRMYHDGIMQHLWTTCYNEYNVLVDRGWAQEGVAWYTPETGVPVHRLFHPGIVRHHYTADQHEISVLVQRGWNNEGVLFYCASTVVDEEDRTAMTRLYLCEPYRMHLHTADANEIRVLTEGGWINEGKSFYGLRR